MGKELSEMTNEELWELFPIFLVEHNEKWQKQYAEMEERLNKALSGCPVKRISHVGSTAIKDIWAKDIVDVLIEAKKEMNDEESLETIANVLETEGFRRIYTEEGRIFFNLGYTKEGFADKVYHIHIRYEGDNDELYFRDYLNEFPDVAKEYEKLKLELWKKYEHDRDAYTFAKTELIKKYTVEAKELYGEKY